MTRKDIINYNYELYEKRTVPSTWVFNDFGHKTCYYFKDINGNAVLDKGKEQIHGEFLHTTPLDEANSSRGLTVTLDYSHGCIHIKPRDIDELSRRGYIKRGNLFFVHGYSEKAPNIRKNATVSGPYEVHFFPGARKILVRGQVVGGSP